MTNRIEDLGKAAWEKHMADLGEPEWWHQGGHKLVPKGITTQLTGPSLTIESNTVSLTIASRLFKEVGWHIGWRINYAHTADRDHVDGSLTFQDRHLKLAFGLDNRIEDEYKWLMSRYNASVAHQGLYIRRLRWLNIPEPGTGLDGTPNLSIFVDEDIQSSVRDLLSKPRRSITQEKTFRPDFITRAVAEYKE